MTAQTYTIPVGPLHVALEEPMYFRIDLRGETVANVELNAGHVHRGVEYLATKRSMFQNVVLTERIDHFGFGGEVVHLRIMGAHEITGTKIRAWRDYFDMPHGGTPT